MDDSSLVQAFEAALNTSNWDEAVLIIDENYNHFASGSKEIFLGKNKNLITKLIYAAVEKDYSRVIDVIISHGCDVNYGIKMPFRSYGRSPLYHASKLGRQHIVQMLMEGGSDGNCLNNTGNTALYEAVFEGHIEVVKTLTDYNCDPNIPDVYGKTPLHLFPYSIGTTEQKEDCMKLLLENGADITIKSNNSQTALDEAIQFKHSTTLKILMENAHRLGYRKLPHSTSALDEYILPEYIVSTMLTPETIAIGEMLVQLHPCHIISQNTTEEILHICQMDSSLPMAFNNQAKRLYELMVLSGISCFPSKHLPTLQECCRLSLRRHFGEECWYRVHFLPVPDTVKDFLSLRDSIDI